MTPFHFDPKAYGPSVADLLAEPRLMPLGPGSLHPAARAALRQFNPANDLGRPVADRDAAIACHAGLWLYHDGLAESHAISQGLDTPEGSFWHAVMHRREPDPWNSKYWWKRVGSHPVLTRLVTGSPALGYNYTNSPDFVHFCERVRGTNTPDEELAKRVQLLEWQLLFDHCYRMATGA